MSDILHSPLHSLSHLSNLILIPLFLFLFDKMAYPGGFGGEIGGPGFGIPGAGLGGGLNLDVGGGIGGGGLLGGGLPGWAGPYIPVTPLGALGGIKGDLIVPIVAVGVALFLLVLIVLAVKFALAWKVGVLEDLTGSRRFRRDAESAKAPQLQDDYMMQLAKVVTSAVYSGSCSDRIICDVGMLTRGNAKMVNGIISLVDSYVPSSYKPYLDILKSSSEGDFDCAKNYQCNDQGQGQPGINNPVSSSSTTSPQVNPNLFQGQAMNAQTPRPMLQDLFNGSATNEIRPQQRLGKFRRSYFSKK